MKIEMSTHVKKIKRKKTSYKESEERRLEKTSNIFKSKATKGNLTIIKHQVNYITQDIERGIKKRRFFIP